MSTIGWTCEKCGYRAQRRGIDHPTTRFSQRCPKCRTLHKIYVSWESHVDWRPANVFGEAQ